MTMVRRYRHPIVTLVASTVLIVASVLLPSGCSSGSGCKATAVRVISPQLTDTTVPFDVTATVTASGKPLAGVNVEFWGWGRPPGQESTVGSSLGVATTGSDGAAVVHVPALLTTGVASDLGRLSGTDFVEVSANAAAATVSGHAYCASKGRALVTCLSGSCKVSL